MERQLYALQGAIASRVLQILNGISKLRAGGAEDRAFVLWARDFAQQKQVDMKVRGLGNLLDVFNASFIVLASATLFASIAFFQKDISTGVFVTFNTAFMQFLSATLALAGALTGSLSIIPLYERAKPILRTLPEQQESQIRAAPLQGEVEISRVSFRYAEDGPLILDDVSIRVKEGEFVAFVGPSGSGKSTIFRVLLGFEKPQSGAVYYDSQDLDGLDAGSVRRQLGVVLQNGKLMPGDIYTNIVGSSPRTLDEAWEAARMAGLAQDIKAMPMGMQTVISEGAGTISGGQRQRLMIARALVNRPAVLLFDEATSALDNQTQAIVANSVKQLEATRIVIAHRLSTIIAADRIFVIVAGKVVETGNYSELMALGGHFAELSKRQQV
jgi:ATP-binding cassette subfamily C protein